MPDRVHQSPTSTQFFVRAMRFLSARQPCACDCRSAGRIEPSTTPLHQTSPTANVTGCARRIRLSFSDFSWSGTGASGTGTDAKPHASRGVNVSSSYRLSFRGAGVVKFGRVTRPGGSAEADPRSFFGFPNFTALAAVLLSAHDSVRLRSACGCREVFLSETGRSTQGSQAQSRNLAVRQMTRFVLARVHPKFLCRIDLRFHAFDPLSS